MVSAATAEELQNTQQMVHTRCYRDGVLTDEGFPLKDVSEHLEDPSAMVWVDLCAPDLADLQLVADELGLHTLAVEDATSGRQRPKFTRYTGHDSSPPTRCNWTSKPAN